jgi:hypothetical protein
MLLLNNEKLVRMTDVYTDRIIPTRHEGVMESHLEVETCAFFASLSFFVKIYKCDRGARRTWDGLRSQPLTDEFYMQFEREKPPETPNAPYRALLGEQRV